MITFLHQHVAGLQLLEPGYHRSGIAPRPGGGIISARAHHDSPHGRISLTWTIQEGQAHLAVKVPAGTDADLALPDGSSDTVGAGRNSPSWTEDRA